MCIRDRDIYVWDMTTGKTRVLCTVPDGGDMGVALSQSGEIMAVNVYGMLYKFSAEDGTLLLTRKLDSTAPGRLDCLIKVDVYKRQAPHCRAEFRSIHGGRGYAVRSADCIGRQNPKQ